MKIALIGYGKMGKMIHEVAKAKGHSIVAVIDSKISLNEPATQHFLNLVDVCIDFSAPQAILGNLTVLTSLKKNIVVGTTGWDDDLKAVTELVEKSNIGLLYAPNFSLGIALFLKIIEQAARLVAPFGEYEVAGIEIHHSKKLDAPSGTAKVIETELNRHFSHHSIAFSSVRVGYVPGTHSIIFDCPVDTITLTHSARNRSGLAEGALQAAEWLQGKKGFFTLEDFLKERMNHAEI